MRPQQQNRRMRGRNNNGGGNNNSNNNNRKGPNPLTRNYESNGPDVKIRGSAQQIAEKYAQLARDSHSSGDRVMAENYLQHAEHYNRIIAAAQAQLPIQSTQGSRDSSDDNDNDDEREEFDGQGSGRQNNPQAHDGQSGAHHNRGGGDDLQQGQENPGAGPQPVIEGTPAEVALNSDASGSSSARSGRQTTGFKDETSQDDETPAAPRRGRRPRRPKPEAGEEAGSESGLAQTLSRGLTPEPAAEKSEKSDAPLIDADS